MQRAFSKLKYLRTIFKCNVQAFSAAATAFNNFDTIHISYGLALVIKKKKFFFGNVSCYGCYGCDMLSKNFRLKIVKTFFLLIAL